VVWGEMVANKSVAIVMMDAMVELGDEIAML
jgi:hypothetical protein